MHEVFFFGRDFCHSWYGCRKPSTVMQVMLYRALLSGLANACDGDNARELLQLHGLNGRHVWPLINASEGKWRVHRTAYKTSAFSIGQFTKLG